jgi:prophage antirepressor-like protein
MSDVTVQKHEEFGEIRIVDREGDPWFVANDICNVLGYVNATQALQDHCKQDLSNRYQLKLQAADGKFYNTVIISELNLNRLIMNSKMPNAVKIQDWICGEVLPSIRKTGGYGEPKEKSREEVIELAKRILRDEEERSKLESQKSVLVKSIELIMPDLTQFQKENKKGNKKESLVSSYFRFQRNAIREEYEYNLFALKEAEKVLLENEALVEYKDKEND